MTPEELIQHRIKKQKADKKYTLKNQEKLKEFKRQYYIKNKDIINIKAAARYKANPQPVIDKAVQWQKNNPGKSNARSMRRIASKLKATPVWLDELMLLYIEELYDKAVLLRKITGKKYHVDHIVPLQGKNVCGLHVPWNLQILTNSDNCSKRNKLPNEIDLVFSDGWFHG